MARKAATVVIVLLTLAMLIGVFTVISIPPSAAVRASPTAPSLSSKPFWLMA